MARWNWKFIEKPEWREQCTHVWVVEFTGFDGQFVHSESRCPRDGKYRNGDEVRCGYHTPGVGRKGDRRVPKDEPVACG